MSNKIACLIPTRGDRPEFLKFCLYQLGKQTLLPDIIELVNDTPISNNPDLTYRYRVGIERCLQKGADIIFFIEDDDNYSKDYIKTMYNLWLKNRKPPIIGINSTIYYHIFTQKYSELSHRGHSSMMSTGVTRAVLDIDWPSDDHIFLDLWIWRRMNGVLCTIKDPICVGIKHNIGLCGGMAHKNGWGKNQDKDFDYLSKKIDKEALEFYKNVR